MMRTGRPVPNSGINIVRGARGEYRVTDLERARAFYVDLLGLVLTEATPDALYLRGLEERVHHSLVLRKADSPGAGPLGFRVASEDDLERAATFCRASDLPFAVRDAGSVPGLGRSLRMQDPFGLPLELFATMEPAERMLQRFDLHRGAHPMRFDHFNCQIPDVDAGYAWYADELGFGCSEYTAGANGDGIFAAWMQRKGNVHDLALMTGIGPRVHHIAYWVADTLSVLRACDVLAAAGFPDSIERGPGRHGISNAFFLYLRDPDGNRIELYANDYQVLDPDWEPIRWDLEDPRRATFWGHVAPPSWFDEAGLCESVVTGELLVPSRPVGVDRPAHAATHIG